MMSRWITVRIRRDVWLKIHRLRLRIKRHGAIGNLPIGDVIEFAIREMLKKK